MKTLGVKVSTTIVAAVAGVLFVTAADLAWKYDTSSRVPESWSERIGLLPSFDSREYVKDVSAEGELDSRSFDLKESVPGSLNSMAPGFRLFIR